MPGPAPKNPATRQRRNQRPSRALLPPETEPRTDAPELPALRQWEVMTLAWWRDVWASPMATEYTRADEHALFRLAVLIDMFWFNPSRELAAEIRLQQQAFGLTPLDRNRLAWTIEQTELAQAHGDRQRSKRAIVVSGDRDPRELLKK